MQEDNNLVLYDALNKAYWSTRTNSDAYENSSFFINQYGNIYLIDKTATVRWSSIANG